MGWVGASYGSVSKQTRVSKPDSRIENRRAKLQKCRGGGMTTYPYIYIHTHVCLFSSSPDPGRRADPEAGQEPSACVWASGSGFGA